MMKILSKAICIVIPSYKETVVLSTLLNQIEKVAPKASIILVDDSPPAENQQIQAMTAHKKYITLISRGKKQGRGSAVIRGFIKSLEQKHVQYIFEMDSDLAHNPEALPIFLEKMKHTNCDLVVGSRYITGGQVTDMPWYRIIISKVSNLFLHLLLGVKLTDYTSGFRLYSRAAVSYITKTPIQTTGFITLSEIAYRLYRGGFIIEEVPITVQARTAGSSTVTLQLLLESLWSIIKIRLGAYTTSK